MTFLERQCNRPEIRRLLLPTILLVGAYFGYANWFYLDDAYIAFRYALNFSEGHGFVWYPGSREYGYTNFLFTVMVGLLMKLGLSAENASSLISFPAYLMVLVITFHMGRRWLGSYAAGAIASLLLATHLTMNGYATSGLETSLQAALILSAYHLGFRVMERRFDARSQWLLGLVVMLALLVRLDSGVLMLPLYLVLAFLWLGEIRHKHCSLAQMMHCCFRVGLFPVLGLIALMAFCYANYGQFLPNSFYVKLDGDGHFDNGLRYLFSYLLYQELALVFVVVMIVGMWAARRFSFSRDPYVWSLLAAMLCWMAYLLYAGGDFMQFRFMVPVLPLMTLYVCAVFMRFARSDNRDFFAILLLTVLGYGNYVQRDYFTVERRVDPAGVESFALMASHVMSTEISWSHAGKTLNRLFYTGSPDDVHIAVTSAGAVPYFSRLPTLDMIGLNSRGVISNSEPLLPDKPGHAISATLGYIISQQVHLIIGHPNFLQIKNGRFHCLPIDTVMVHRQVEEPVVLIALGNDFYLPAIYLKQHPAIEKQIKSGNILYLNDIKERVDCAHVFLSAQYRH